MRTIGAVLLACLLGLPGCANETTFANHPVTGEGQALKPIYGQPTLFSEGEHLVALGIDQHTFLAEEGVVFLRLWVYNGGGSTLSMSHQNVSAWALEHGGNGPVGEDNLQVSSLSQSEFEEWRQDHTRRKILSIRNRYKGTPVTDPRLSSRGLEARELYGFTPEASPASPESRYANELLDGLDSGIRCTPVPGGPGSVSCDGNRQRVYLDHNPHNRMVREIRYLRTTPKYRHLMQIEALAPGTVEGGYIALDIGELPEKTSRTLAVTVDAGGEQHLFHIDQQRLDPE